MSPEVKLEKEMDVIEEEEEAVSSLPTCITRRVMLEILEHEAIVLEAYYDSVGILTWGVGVTNASGHHVERYVGKPSTIARAIEIYAWLLRERYLPGVLRAFKGHTPTENELCAALSFHYNTGAIEKASWVKSFMAGNRAKARKQFMNWSKPKEIIGRRKAERDLFFDNHWTQDGVVLLYDVNSKRKPFNPRPVDVSKEVAAVL